ncbi:MAG: glycosyltransferase [Microcoleaceae cyanobacterium]
MPEKPWSDSDNSNSFEAKSPPSVFAKATESEQLETSDNPGLESPANPITRAHAPTATLVSPREHSQVLAVPRQCYQNRRRKAAVVLKVVWGGTITLHLFSWGFWLVLGLSGLISIPMLQLFTAHPRYQGGKLRQGVRGGLPQELPFISLLVAAKNEEAVIGDLVKNLCQLNYPKDCYELWVIDDNSTDQTPEVLKRLEQQYDQLKVLHRQVTGGGKSGALNQVLPLVQGEILGVFDADAQVSTDLLQQVVPLFTNEQLGAVQVRKTISNAPLNFWTQSQAAEMGLDLFMQHGRIGSGGFGELRGNGQFVRRVALESCEGWNEETITDDLDLTFRLHLNRWGIELLTFPPVHEEGVTHWSALWHQRNRWAEGGYQRYLDYWQLLIRNRMGTRKSLNALGFLMIQYLLPTITIPDLLMAAMLRRIPLTAPLATLTIFCSFTGMIIGLRRIRQFQVSYLAEASSTEKNLTEKSLTEESLESENSESENSESENSESETALASESVRMDRVEPAIAYSNFQILLQSLRGTLYMLHWFVVIGSTTLRMSVRPKRLKWIKTVHQGSLDSAPSDQA